jgi:hypothetical protein
MRILFLSQLVPYPPDAGPKVRSYNVIRYLVSVGMKSRWFVLAGQVTYQSRLITSDQSAGQFTQCPSSALDIKIYGILGEACLVKRHF